MDTDKHRFEQERTEKRPALLPVPTLVEVMVLLIRNGMNCGTFVQEPTATREAGIAVMLLNTDAIKKIGPMLREKVCRLKDRSAHSFKLQGPVPITEFFNELKRNEMEWFYVDDENSKISGYPGSWMVIFFLGNKVVTPEFCEELTRLGCPTRLD